MPGQVSLATVATRGHWEGEGIGCFEGSLKSQE